MKNKKRTIIYIGGFELPDKNAAAHRVRTNAKILKKLGRKVVYIGVNRENKTKIFIDGNDEAFCIKYPKTKKEWINYLSNPQEYIQIIEKYDNVESIILYNFQAVIMNKLIRYCKKHDIKIYSDVTEWYSANGHGFIYKVLKGFDTWFRMRVLNRKVDGLILVSKYLMSYYKDVNNRIYLPILTDLNDIKWLNDYKKSHNKLMLVYAGNPGKKDEIKILINAIQQVKRPYHLDIVGISEEEYFKNYNIEKISFDSSKIEFHGRLCHNDALNFIKKANYSIFFRENNRVTKAGFPTKFVEAISCKTPVITNKSSNINDYFNGKNGLCIDSIDVDEISRAIERIPYECDTNESVFDYNNYIDQVANLIK